MSELREELKKKAKELMKKYLKKKLIFEVKDSDFKEKVIERSKATPVLVDFYSDFCPPCRMLAPVLERVILELNGKVLLAKANVDLNPLWATKLGVIYIPNLKIFCKGKIISELIGFAAPEKLKAWILNSLKECK